MEPFEANAHDEELWDGTPAETPELEQLAEADRQISEAFRYQPRVTLFNLITSYTDEDHNDPDYHPIGTPFRDALNIVRYELGIDDDRDELPRVYTTELARIDELKQADEAAADERIAALGSSGDAGRQEDDRSDATTEPPPDPAAARAKQEAQARERFEAMGEAQAEDRAEDRADPEVNGTAADESTAQRRPQPPGGDGPPAAAPSESSNDDHENPGIAPERAPVPRTGPRLDAGNQDTSSGDPPSAGEGESRTVVPTGQQYPAATIEQPQDGDTGEAPAEDQQPPPPGQPHPQTGGGGGASSGLAEGANDPTTPETEDPAERDQQGQDDSRTATSTGQQYPAAIVEERNNTETDRAAPPPKEAELNQNRIGASHAKENRNAERAPTPTNNNQGPPATPAQPSQADKEALQEAARESGGSGRPTL